MTHNEFHEIAPPPVVLKCESKSERLIRLRKAHGFKDNSSALPGMPIRNESDLERQADPLREEALARYSRFVIEKHTYHFLETVNEIEKKVKIPGSLENEFMEQFMQEVSFLSTQFKESLQKAEKSLDNIRTNDGKMSIEKEKDNLKVIHDKIIDLNKDLHRFIELDAMLGKVKALFNPSSNKPLNIEENIKDTIEDYKQALHSHNLENARKKLEDTYKDIKPIDEQIEKAKSSYDKLCKLKESNVFKVLSKEKQQELEREIEEQEKRIIGAKAQALKDFYGKSKGTKYAGVGKLTYEYKHFEKLREDIQKGVMDMITQKETSENTAITTFFYEMEKNPEVALEVKNSQYHLDFQEHREKYQKNRQAMITNLKSLQEAKFKEQENYAEAIKGISKDLDTIGANRKTFIKSYDALRLVECMYDYKHNVIEEKILNYKREVEDVLKGESKLSILIDQCATYQKEFCGFEENFVNQQIASDIDLEDIIKKYKKFKNLYNVACGYTENGGIRTFKEVDSKMQDIDDYNRDYQDSTSWLIKNTPIGRDFNEKVEKFKEFKSRDLKGQELLSAILEMREVNEKLLEQFDNFKCLVEIQEAISKASENLVSLESYRSDHKSTIATMEKYFEKCVKTLGECSEKSQEYIKSEQIDRLKSKYVIMKNLSKARREFKFAKSLIEQREELPTAKHILEKYSNNISEELIKSHKEVSDIYLREVAQNRLKKESRNLTGEEFEDYYQTFLKDVDQKMQTLFEKADVWMRRDPDALIKTLKSRCGRFITSINAGIEEAGYNMLDNLSFRYGLANRNTSENALYGYPKDLPIEQRLLYAYTSEDPNGQPDHERMEHFGSVAIRFKSKVKEQRSTKLLGDPWEITDGKTYLDSRPVLYNEASRECFPIHWEFMEKNDPRAFSTEYERPLPDGSSEMRPCRMKYVDPLEIKSVNEIRPWPEVEIHAGLTIDDVEEVVFLKPLSRDEKDELIPLLNQYSIKYRDLSTQQTEA